MRWCSTERPARRSGRGARLNETETVDVIGIDLRVTASLTIQMLETIYRGGYARFLRFALAVVGDRESAAEVVQEAFAKAIRSRFQFRGEGTPEAWVWRIVLNVARDQARGEPLPLDLAGDEPCANGHADEWSELRAAVAALPERQRLTVFLRHYADLDYEQIARVLEVERGTVAATLHAAHAALRKQMTEVTR